MSIKKLQQRIGITDDGIFGKNTFKAASNYFNIKTKNRAVHFWAQVAHETAGFTRFEENLNYSEEGLLIVFKRHFDSNSDRNIDSAERKIAKQLARKPEEIANFVYANRMGNGNECSGDGWKYRGRGALHLTGRYNYERFGNYIKDLRIIDNPILVITKYCFDSALFFFDTNNLWAICDKGLSNSTIGLLTTRINGGLNGLSERIKLTNKYSKWEI